MGSLRKAKSSGTSKGPSSEHAKLQTDLYEVRHHFSEALAVVQTVAHALHAAENDLHAQRLERK